MANRLTPQDLIKSASHFNGDIFEWDYKHASDNQTNHSKKGIKASYDTTWVPILFRKIDSEENETKVPVKALDFQNVIVSSKPTLPSKDDSGADSKNKVKCMLLVFKEMELGEIRTGDYIPKIKDTPEAQEVENKRMEKMIKILHQNTKEFTDALNVVATGFQLLTDKICEQFIHNPDSFPFNMAKESNWVIKDKDGSIKFYNPPIRSIRQTHRKDEKNPNKAIRLEKPIYRLKMPVTDNKMLVSWRNRSGIQETADYVFDARKTIIDKRTGSNTLVPAKIRSATTGLLCPLDVNNVGDFIRYKSIISGRLELPKLVISKQGISLVNEFKQLVVKRYKAENQTNVIVSNDTLLFMKGESDNEDDPVETLPELNASANKSNEDADSDKKDDDDDVSEKADADSVNNATDSSEEEVEVQPVVKKTPAKKVTKVVKKPIAKKTPVKADDDSDVEIDD